MSTCLLGPLGSLSLLSPVGPLGPMGILRISWVPWVFLGHVDVLGVLGLLGSSLKGTQKVLTLCTVLKVSEVPWAALASRDSLVRGVGPVSDTDSFCCFLSLPPGRDASPGHRGRGCASPLTQI